MLNLMISHGFFYGHRCKHLILATWYAIYVFMIIVTLDAMFCVKDWNILLRYFLNHPNQIQSRYVQDFNLKLTWTVIYDYKRQPYFFWRTFIWNMVLARCMSWLISFASASSSCKERKRDLQNEKFFLPTAGLELTTFGLRDHRLNR